MEINEFTKLITAIITAVGSITIVSYNISQAKRITAELIEKFEGAVKNKQKHSVTELFRLIHGVRIGYKEIVEIIEHDDCQKIILALRKSPGTADFNNNRLVYTTLGSNRLFQFVDRWFSKAAIIIFPIMMLGTLTMIVFGEQHIVITGFILLAVICIAFVYEIRELSLTHMISRLIQGDHD